MQLIILLFCLFLTACSSNQEEPEKEAPAIPVLTIHPVTRDVPIYIEAIGSLKPTVLFEVRSEVEGRITKVHVKEGEYVKKGSPLITIDRKPFLIKVHEIQAELASDKANVKAAQKKLERFKSLAEKDLISKDEWEEYITQAEIAKAKLALNKARLKAAKLDLSRCTIYSPINGKLGAHDQHVGKSISRNSDPLAHISQIDTLIVECSITEKDARQITPLLKQSETLDIGIQSIAAPDLKAKASLYYINTHFDPKTGLLLLRAKVENPDTLFLPGQAVRVRLPIGMISDALLLPQKAVKFNEAGSYVYVVDPASSVELRMVSVGENYGNEIVILDGLKVTDQVITDGHMRLYPGAKVKT